MLNTGESRAVERLQWRCGLIVPLSEHTTALFHSSFIFSTVLCAYGKKGRDEFGAVLSSWWLVLLVI